MHVHVLQDGLRGSLAVQKATETVEKFESSRSIVAFFTRLGYFDRFAFFLVLVQLFLVHTTHGTLTTHKRNTTKQ